MNSSTAYVPPFTVDQVAAMLSCSDRTVRARAAELGGVKFGTDYVFPAGALFQRLDAIALQAAQAKTPAPTPTAVVQQLPGGRRKAPPALPRLVGDTPT